MKRTPASANDWETTLVGATHMLSELAIMPRQQADDSEPTLVGTTNMLSELSITAIQDDDASDEDPDLEQSSTAPPILSNQQDEHEGIQDNAIASVNKASAIGQDYGKKAPHPKTQKRLYHPASFYEKALAELEPEVVKNYWIKRGDKVYARWPNNDQYYWGEIKDILHSGPHVTYLVRYVDGDEAILGANDMNRSKEVMELKKKGAIVVTPPPNGYLEGQYQPLPSLWERSKM